MRLEIRNGNNDKTLKSFLKPPVCIMAEFIVDCIFCFFAIQNSFLSFQRTFHEAQSLGNNLDKVISLWTHFSEAKNVCSLLWRHDITNGNYQLKWLVYKIPAKTKPTNRLQRPTEDGTKPATVGREEGWRTLLMRQRTCHWMQNVTIVPALQLYTGCPMSMSGLLFESCFTNSAKSKCQKNVFLEG